MGWQAHCEQILQAIAPGRQLALDVFRGITITAMILVNNPGSWQFVYAPLQHAKWHGWTPTDLIFPFFLFIVGVALVLARPVGAVLSASQKQRLLLTASWRSLQLIGLGLLLAAFWYRFNDVTFSYWQHIAQLRWPGVLQRIGLVYLLAVLTLFYLPSRYWLLLALLVLTGYGSALQLYAQQPALQGELLISNNLVGYLDSYLLGSEHLYQKQLRPFAFDPEGLLSTLPAWISCLLGMYCGLLLKQQPLQVALRQLVLYALVLLALSGVLSLWQPINKALWTPAFVCLSGGMALLSYALLLWLTELQDYRRWTAPFVVFGANAILFFMFAGISARLMLMLPVGEQSLKAALFSLLQVWLGDYPASLAFALLFMLGCYLIMHLCYRRGWIWRL